jgi:hypothetical protein
VWQVYFCPHANDNIASLNTLTSVYAVTTLVGSGFQAHCGCTGIGTKIYLTPAAGTKIRIFDTVSKAVAVVSIGVENGNYCGGAVVGTKAPVAS